MLIWMCISRYIKFASLVMWRYICVTMFMRDSSSEAMDVVWYPGPGLNRIDRILIPTRCNFFSGSSFPENFQVKRAWPRAIWGWVTDRELDPGGAWVRTKCIWKTCVVLWGSLEVLESCQGNRPGPGLVGHVARHGTRHGTCACIGRMDVCQEGTFLDWGWLTMTSTFYGVMSVTSWHGLK
jgi:hypothetical protein